MEVFRPILIVDYDSQWQSLYEEEKLRILGVAEQKILGIEHIGSTAVVGLGAKPIIDIMAGVSSFSDADELLLLLSEIGYEDATRQAGGSEWYYCLSKDVHEEKVRLQNYNLHLMKFRSETWERHILFRDLLRNHPEIAKKYYELKRMLAAKHGADRESYTKAKTKFITSWVTQARRK